MEEATAPQGGVTPEPGTDPAGRKRGPHPDAGKYIVLGAKPTEEGELHSFQVISEAIVAEGGAEAKRKAIANSAELQEAIAGEGVVLVAVPAMSFKPKLAKAKQQDPIIEGL